MNKRIRITIIFSAPNFSYQKVLDLLGPKFSQLFAGACFQEIDGVWSLDGDEDQGSYQVGQQEKGMKILLSVTPDKQDFAKEQTRELLQMLKEELNLPIFWVHYEQEEVTAHHFSLK